MIKRGIPYSLLAKYFAKQCSLDEKQNVLSWCDKSTENKKIFNKLQRNWKAVHLGKSFFVIPDTEKTWAKIQSKIGRNIKPFPTYSRFMLIRVACIAALFALLTGSGITYWITNRSGITAEARKLEIVAPPGQRMKLVLPDKTLVWLNSNSQITYYSDFNIHNRSIELNGEAFFEVTESEKDPFTVKAGVINVKVHGTKFNVKSYEKDKNITVSLAEGSISLLSALNNKTITFLEPNQKAIVSKNNLLFTVNECNTQAESSWHMGMLYFDNLPAKEVWEKLEGWYGVRIMSLNQKSDQKYRFKVKTESLTELLELINKLTPIEYKINGEEVTVRYR